MLCLPGFTPVAKLAQATGDSEGWVEPRVRKTPLSARRLRFGSLPSAMNWRAKVGSMPSKPITNTRCLARRRGLPAGPDEQWNAVSPIPAAAASTSAREEKTEGLLIITGKRL